MTKNKRYFVDERSGCIAVRDREQTDPEHNGLHSDTKGVVKYWHGYRDQQPCPCCNQMRDLGWKVKDEDKIAATKLCEAMNERR